ncbi:MAG: UDP-N-acetylmuramoyl-L-alanyl-D-glutamate--2,6-diaminopimelate ligase [Clostridia bacterium]|nr:UDP-N-acetylmuramoyl-L-alanyl-D-glutamate--2,6-diaminopimelate ligase [Clostridia bacterium]
MLLSELIKNIEYKETKGKLDAEIKGLAINDSLVKEGDLFFCINGTNTDGHEFASLAASRGAAAVVCERPLEVNASQVIVEDVRLAMSLIAKDFYGRPSEKLRVKGVTGTNGKTTTCHLIRNVLRSAGHETGLIGTLGIFYGNVEIAPELTTPDPIFLHKIFADMVKAGVEIVVMEVSAHAVALKKIEGIKFEAGVFTNCTQDHLDFFGNMERYEAAKAEFLTDKYCDFTVFNTDDELGRKLFLSAGRNSVSYGIDAPSDVFAVNVKEEISGTAFVMNLFDNIYNVKCRMAGVFSVYNCLAAATCCAVLNVDFDDIVDGINRTEGVRGRIELVKNLLDKKVFIDYAHTPDGLGNVLKTLRKCTPGKLICLFGCGGNRDKTKRPLMGEISGELADFTVLTSDNPRFEDPCDIISEVESGLKKKTNDYITIQDRKSAIKYAVSKTGKDDVLLIAGKGAEDYQEIMGVRHEFNDRKFVEAVLDGGNAD